MNLTSWRRLRHFLGRGDPLEDDVTNKRRYLNWIPIISNRIETFLDRTIKLDSYTEYFDTVENRLEYQVKAWPISSITSVKADSLGLYDGSESSQTNYYIGMNADSIVLDTDVLAAYKGLQAVYTGGLASHGTRSQFVLSDEGGTAISAGDYVMGDDTETMGYVISKSGTAITIEVLYGVYEVGEAIQAQSTEAGGAISGATATLASATARSLVETYPEIAAACELEIRYMDDHRSDYENQSTDKGSTSRKDLTQDYNLLPETRSLIEKYRRLWL